MFFLPTLGRNCGVIYMSDPISHQEAKQRWCKDHFIIPRAHIIFSPLQDSTSTWIKSVRPWAGGGKAGSPTRFRHSSIKQFWKIAINMHVHNARVWKYYDQKHNFFFQQKDLSYQENLSKINRAITLTCDRKNKQAEICEIKTVILDLAMAEMWRKCVSRPSGAWRWLHTCSANEDSSIISNYSLLARIKHPREWIKGLATSAKNCVSGANAPTCI